MATHDSKDETITARELQTETQAINAAWSEFLYGDELNWQIRRKSAELKRDIAEIMTWDIPPGKWEVEED